METIEETVEAREYVFNVSIRLKNGQMLHGSEKIPTKDPERTGKALVHRYKQMHILDYEDGHFTFSGPI